MKRVIFGILLLALLAFCSAQTQAAEQTFRLYRGVTLYVHNPEGKDFNVNLQVRDMNIYANGPREVLFKVYGPDGKPVVREIVPDDGIVAPAFQDRIGGWDHELMYYANLYAKGTKPSTSFSTWSDPKRLAAIKARVLKRPIKGKGKGIYRIVLAGTSDHFVTVGISHDLPFAVGGHPSFIHGHGDMLKKSYVYVPKNTSGLFFILIEPDPPAQRTFKLTAPDGKVLFEGKAKGGYIHPDGGPWRKKLVGFKKGGYDGKLLTLEVSSGKGAFLVCLTLQQPRKGPFKVYTGMGSQALFAPDKETAMALKGGTIIVDDTVFWHPFQVRLHNWLKANPKGSPVRNLAHELYNGFRMFETSDGIGSSMWANWAYAFGYYGCKIWRPAWVLMQRKDVPADLRAIVNEGLIMGGDRLSFATGMERVNGNAFSQINVALWYCHRATGDALQKQRFETFWSRWVSGEGWGKGCGLSKSGDSQEHFSHDLHYGSYLMDNWLGKQWVSHGILDDAQGKDPRFQKVVERYRELYSYLYCRDKGRAFQACPWSSRTYMPPHAAEANWEPFGHTWKGEPGKDFTVSVNDGDEWFAARRKNYYMLTFHGRLAPEWMSRTFEGQLGFGGGVLCQLTVPGKGPVLASSLFGSYGKGMDPSEWANFRIHSIVGETWNGRPLIASISDHENSAKLKGNTVTSSGEVRNAHVKVARSYTYKVDRIACSVSLAESDYAKGLSIWSPGRKWSQVRLAYEMIPFMPPTKKGAVRATATVDGKPLTKELTKAKTIRIDRGGFGVDIILPKAMPVKLGNSTVMIQLTAKEVKPKKIALTYELVPFRK
jgi:hypothetical protein